jgi:multidrug efflux pump subunit AcrA (membrane-fusion protein)
MEKTKSTGSVNTPGHSLAAGPINIPGYSPAAGVFFLILLCVLLLFSRTIYSYHLPEVAGVKPFRGTLNKFEISSGAADWTDVDTAYAVVGGMVEAVFVKEGETVRTGQALFQMGFDVEAAERELREIRNNIRKLQNDIDYTAVKLQNLVRALDRPEGGDDAGAEYREPPRPDLVSLDLNKARLALGEAELSYELGAKSRYDLEAARDNVTALYLKYEGERTALEFDLEAKNIDLQNLRLREESCRDTLENYRTYAVIPARVEGVVVSLNVKKGMYVQEKTPMVSIGLGQDFTLECTVSPENNFIIPGDTCELSNSSHVLEGVVSRVKPSAQGKTVSVTVISGEVRAGESFDIIFEKNSAASYTLVPNAALNQDNDGYFLNQIKRRKGILGEEYYAERLDVYIGDSDPANTAIIKGMSFFEPVILRSSKPVLSGDVVSLTNPGDFFER